MAIDIKTDATGVEISINGAVGDAFAETLFVVGHVGKELKKASDISFASFANYILSIISAIHKSGGENGEFDLLDFSDSVLRLIRSDPNKAEEIYEKLLVKYDDEVAANILVLLSLPSDYIEPYIDEPVGDFIN